MRKSPEGSATPEANYPKFNEGDVIVCPTDITQTKWKVTGAEGKTVLAVVLGGEKYPSQQYPKTIEISPEAQNEWEKI